MNDKAEQKKRPRPAQHDRERSAAAAEHGPPNARAVAIDALVAIEKDDSFANLRLGKLLERSGLDDRDRRFVTELVYGCIRRRRSLDYLVDRFLSSDPPPVARAALRLGAYQLYYLEVPDHAAVSATVDVVPKRLRGMVNAVLRKVASSPVNWPDAATELSYPDWIVERLSADLGTQVALDALAVMNTAPDVHVRDDGYVQDRSSQRVVEALPIEPGQLVIDACAAPGGKATAMAARCARVVGADLRLKRVGLIAQNAASTAAGRPDGAALWPLVSDARSLPFADASVDGVLVDAPCSGLGVLRRRPDARWRINPDDVERLSAIQRSILDEAARVVAPGGWLAYSVCTLTRAETIAVAEWFGDAHREFAPVPFVESPWEQLGTGGRLLPQSDDGDGMALFVWRRPTA